MLAETIYLNPHGLEHSEAKLQTYIWEGQRPAAVGAQVEATALFPSAKLKLWPCSSALPVFTLLY